MHNSMHHGIKTKLGDLHYERPIMLPGDRSDYVEYLVEECLGSDWTICWIGPYNSRPHIKHPSGTTLGVRHQAARRPSDKSAKRSFDVSPRCRDEPEPREPALYVFAWHGEKNNEICDQRKPDQWLFFVVPARELRQGQKGMASRQREQEIELRRLQELTHGVGYEELRRTVEQVMTDLSLKHNSMHRNIKRKLANRHYGCRRMFGLHRAVYIEWLVKERLGSDWTLHWKDPRTQRPHIKHTSGKRLAVRQQAALQPSRKPGGKNHSFKVSPLSDLYVFAWHDVENEEVCDQREPDQWRFFVFPTHASIQDQESVDLEFLRTQVEEKQAEEVGYEGLPHAVNRALAVHMKRQ